MCLLFDDEDLQLTTLTLIVAEYEYIYVVEYTINPLSIAIVLRVELLHCSATANKREASRLIELEAYDWNSKEEISISPEIFSIGKVGTLADKAVTLFLLLHWPLLINLNIDLLPSLAHVECSCIHLTMSISLSSVSFHSQAGSCVLWILMASTGVSFTSLSLNNTIDVRQNEQAHCDCLFFNFLISAQ